MLRISALMQYNIDQDQTKNNLLTDLDPTLSDRILYIKKKLFKMINIQVLTNGGRLNFDPSFTIIGRAIEFYDETLRSYPVQSRPSPVAKVIKLSVVVKDYIIPE